MCIGAHVHISVCVRVHVDTFMFRCISAECMYSCRKENFSVNFIYYVYMRAKSSTIRLVWLGGLMVLPSDGVCEWKLTVQYLDLLNGWSGYLKFLLYSCLIVHGLDSLRVPLCLSVRFFTQTFFHAHTCFCWAIFSETYFHYFVLTSCDWIIVRLWMPSFLVLRYDEVSTLFYWRFRHTTARIVFSCTYWRTRQSIMKCICIWYLYLILFSVWIIFWASTKSIARVYG